MSTKKCNSQEIFLDNRGGGMRSDGFRSDRWMPDRFDRADSWGGGKSKGKGKRGAWDDRSRSPRRSDRGGFEGSHWNQGGRNGKGGGGGGGKGGGKGKGRGKGGKGGKGKGNKEAEPMDLDNELDSYFGRAVTKKETKPDGAKSDKMDEELSAYMSGRKEEDLKKMEERKKRFGLGDAAKEAKKDDEDMEEKKDDDDDKETAADDKKEDDKGTDLEAKQKELEGLTKDKLTEMCKAAGLKTSGNKGDLVERIIDDLKKK